MNTLGSLSGFEVDPNQDLKEICGMRGNPGERPREKSGWTRSRPNCAAWFPEFAARSRRKGAKRPARSWLAFMRPGSRDWPGCPIPPNILRASSRAAIWRANSAIAGNERSSSPERKQSLNFIGKSAKMPRSHNGCFRCFEIHSPALRFDLLSLRAGLFL
jgi:hypothetical protein